MTTLFNGGFTMTPAYKKLHCPSHLSSLSQALKDLLPLIPEIISDTPTRLWRGAYMEPGLMRIARAYTINKKRYVINLHVSNIDDSDAIEPHFHPFGDMAVFLVSGAYTNILGSQITEQGSIPNPVDVRIEEGDCYVMSSDLCHDVKDQTNPTFSIMLHEKSNINPGKPEDYEKIFPLSDEKKSEILKDLANTYFSAEVFDKFLNEPVPKKVSLRNRALIKDRTRNRVSAA